MDASRSARFGGRKLKNWQHPAKSGILISEVLNQSAGESFGISYKVTVPARFAGVRQRKQFKTREDAEAFATAERDRLVKRGTEGLSLTPEQWREVATALEQLAPTGIGLLQAVGFALRHMRPEGGDRTVRQVVDEMIAAKKSWLESGEIRASSFRDFKQRTERFAEFFGSMQVKAVALPEIKKWLKSLELSGRSVKNYRMTVGELFSHALQMKYRADNPLDAFTRADRRELEPGADEDRRDPAILSVAEAERLLQTAFAHPELELGAAVALALFCGIRTEELKRLDWSAVRLDDPRPFVKIDRTIAKKRRIRNVEIPPAGLAWLLRCPKREGPVARNAYITDYVKRFAKLTRMAGFGRVGEDDKWVSSWDDNAMRHSFGSYHYALTGDSMATSRLLGHKSNDQVLFDHYRALTTKEAAEGFFALRPQGESAQVIELSVA